MSAPSTCQQWHPGSNSQPASSSHAPPPPMRDKDEILLPSGRSARGCIWHETSPLTQVICHFQFAEIFRMKTAIKFYMDAGLYVEFAELLVFLLRWRSFDTPKILDPFSPDKFDLNRVWSVAEQRLMLDMQAFLECHEYTLCLCSFQSPHFYRDDLTLIHQTVDTARDGGRHDRFAHIEIVSEIEQRVGNPGRCLLMNYSKNIAQILLTQRATVTLFRTKATQRTTATGMMLSGRRPRTSRKTKAREVAFRAYITNKEVSLTATVVVESIAIRQRQDRPVAPLNSSGQRVTQGGTTTAERPRVLCPSRTGSNDRILLWAQCNTSTICDRRHRRNAQQT